LEQHIELLEHIYAFVAHSCLSPTEDAYPFDLHRQALLVDLYQYKGCYVILSHIASNDLELNSDETTEEYKKLVHQLLFPLRKIDKMQHILLIMTLVEVVTYSI
jgi:hypothetical protein